MSYILDALRRADAERDRGNVPSLHTQPAVAAGAYAGPVAARTGPRWIWPAVGGLAVVVLGVVAWRLSGPGTEPANGVNGVNATAGSAVPSPTASTDPTAGAIRAPATAVTSLPVPPSPAPRTDPPPAGTLLPPMPERPAVAPRPVAAAAPRPAAPTRDANQPLRRPSGGEGANASTAYDTDAGRVQATSDAPTPNAAPAGRSPAAANPPNPAPTATAERIEAINELPPEMQREIPKLAVGGSMYSPSPASRLLIVNGQVLHEGASLSPGLVLRQIRLKSAVFTYRDRRFEVKY